MKAKSEIQQQKRYWNILQKDISNLTQFLSNVNPNQSMLDIRLKNMAKSKCKIDLRVFWDPFTNVFVIFINCCKFTIRFRLFPKSYWNSLAATKHNRFAASLIHIIWRVRFLIVPDLRGVVLESCPSSHEDKEKKTTKIASARAILHLFTRGVAIKKAETWDLSLVVFYF